MNLLTITNAFKLALGDSTLADIIIGYHDVHWSCIYSDVTEDASPYRNRTLHTFVEFLQHQRRGL